MAGPSPSGVHLSPHPAGRTEAAHRRPRRPDPGPGVRRRARVLGDRHGPQGPRPHPRHPFPELLDRIREGASTAGAWRIDERTLGITVPPGVDPAAAQRALDGLAERTRTVAVGPEPTAALLGEIPAKFHAGIDDVLLTALAVALARWCRDRGQDQSRPHRAGRPRKGRGLMIRRSEGNIAYLGRTDQQVKIRGHRVELGSVEAVFAAHPAVRHAAAIAQPPPGVDGAHRLAAYLVLANPADLAQVSAEVGAAGLPAAHPLRRQREGRHQGAAGGQAARRADDRGRAGPGDRDGERRPRVLRRGARPGRRRGQRGRRLRVARRPLHAGRAADRTAPPRVRSCHHRPRPVRPANPGSTGPPPR